MSWRRSITAVMTAAAVLVGGASFAVADTAASGLQTASLTRGLAGTIGSLQDGTLGRDDAERYRQIFALQEDGRWTQADKLIGQLEDRLLMGHVLAQRYLHPTHYRSKYKELKDWMASYADHPEAERIYKLAKKRQPRNWLNPPPPQYRAAAKQSRPWTTGPRVPNPRPRGGLSTADRRQAASYKRQLRQALRNGWTLTAKRLLQKKEVQQLLSRAEYDVARAGLGAGYLIDGRDQWAIDWASKAADRSRRYVPGADWTIGLAAWRLGDYGKAAAHFEKLAARNDISPWMVSAGAFWAARARLVDRKPAEVNRLLGLAAAHPRTFYGLLARRLMGLPVGFRWEAPHLEADAAKALDGEPGAKRALALVQVGQRKRAETEMQRLVQGAEPALARGLLALAAKADMPTLALRLDNLLYPRGGGFMGAAYPEGRWSPEGGFRVDRALIHAMIHQESRFNPKATSWAGARGLMQLMPGTASFVAQDRSLRGSNRSALYEPEVNLTLGQKYIDMLLAEPHVGGDLIKLAAAWNGGPGNLRKWWRRTKHQDDPLLFIETIPSAETRDFVERVMTNLWIYRDRFGQSSPSLDAVAAGQWPAYNALDGAVAMVDSNGENRR